MMENIKSSCKAGVLPLVLYIFLAVFYTAEASRDVSEKRECSTCHIMWLKDFNRKDITTLIPFEPKPVVATGKQDVSSTNEMCFSCHDGFVLDSRAVWKSNKHNHPVGIKPSKKITIPTSKGKTIFPLNDDGKVYCGTCHTAHGVDWNQDESPFFLRVKNIESSMCLACHLEKSTGPEEGNHPIFKQPPNKPHTLLQAGSKFANDGGVICQSCHSPHMANNKKILILKNRNSELCLTCHKDKNTISATKHNLDKTAPAALNDSGLTTSESGVCASCHRPHGANGPMLWARNTVKSNDLAADRCLGCHRENGLGDKKRLGEHTHPTKVSVEKLGIKIKKGKWYSNQSLLSGDKHVDLPLYNHKGHKTINGDKVSCGSCHDPHAWSKTGQPSQSEDGDLVEGNHQSSFLRIHQDNQSALCINCHLKQKSVLSTKHNVIKNSKISQQDILHGGVCGQCHMPHNAKGSFLRARDYKTAKGNFSRLCVSCHRKDGIAEDKLIGKHSHPVGVDLNDIPNQSPGLPLYDESGNKIDDKGLVDCVTCHDAHNWAPEPNATKQIANMDSEEGDASNSFLRLSATHNAQLCVECHKDKGLVLGTDHDMSVLHTDTKNHQGQNVAHSGVCGQCHSVHNAVLDVDLWAREPAQAIAMAEKMCLSCHQKNQVAENKVPLQLRHPDKITVWSNKVREKRITQHPIPEIPVFDKDGRRTHVGIITCLSCHDPHQWQPGSNKPGIRKNQEGDAMTSFLRNANSELIICADCHGADSIFRYKYFHGETSRKKYPLYQ